MNANDYEMTDRSERPRRSPSASETPAKRVKRQTPHIPLEVLQQIALHLDKPSASALARVSKGLRDAGETRFWEMVDVTSLWNPQDQVMELPIEEYKRRQDEVTNRVSQITSALDAYPYRAECVRVLRIEPSDGDEISNLPNDLVKLITRLSKGLRRLDILPIEGKMEWDEPEHSSQFGSRSFFQSFEQLPKSTFNRLNHFNLAIPPMCEPGLPLILAKVSETVTELNLCSAEERFSEHYRQGPLEVLFKKFYTKELPRGFPNLLRLTFANLETYPEDTSNATLAQILSMAPKLEFLRVMGNWHPMAKDKALIALSKIKTIKTLVVLTYDSMDLERIGRLGLDSVEEMVCEDEILDEAAELRFENLQFPRMLNAKRLTILTSPRMPCSEYAQIGLGSLNSGSGNGSGAPGARRGRSPSRTGHISHLFIRYLRRTPQLSSIKLHFEEDPYPSMALPNPGEPEYFVPPERWEAEGYRGVVIRQYSPPIAFGRTRYSAATAAAGTGTGTGTDDFWHIRALSRCLEHKSGPSYVGAKRVWRDLTFYKGRTVPFDVLVRAYEAAGLDREWIEGGRGMSFGSSSDWTNGSTGSGIGNGIGIGTPSGSRSRASSSARAGASAGAAGPWHVLQEWRDTVGDESDIEEVIDDSEVDDGVDQFGDSEYDDDDDDDDDGSDMFDTGDPMLDDEDDDDGEGFNEEDFMAAMMTGGMGLPMPMGFRMGMTTHPTTATGSGSGNTGAGAGAGAGGGADSDGWETEEDGDEYNADDDEDPLAM